MCMRLYRVRVAVMIETACECDSTRQLKDGYANSIDVPSTVNRCNSSARRVADYASYLP